MYLAKNVGKLALVKKSYGRWAAFYYAEQTKNDSLAFWRGADASCEQGVKRK
jgi:hypothetical protein